MKGYNPLFGNLLEAGSADPGTRSQIFELNDPDNQDYEFIDVDIDKNCVVNNQESSYQHQYAYSSKKLGSSAKSSGVAAAFSGSASIPIEEFIVNVGAAVGSSSSSSSESSFNDEKDFFSKSSGEIYMNEMRCQLYTVSINQFVQPNFTKNFENGVISLNEAANNIGDSSKKTIKFIEEFGTHYTQKSFFGASLTLESRWASSAESGSERSERQKCVASAYSDSVSESVGIPGIFDESSSSTFKGRFHSTSMSCIYYID